MARPMPVVPDVPSMIVPPGLSSPARSASSIILTAMRSLMELPGLNVSSLARTVAGTIPFVIALMRTSGVPPMASRMESQIFFTEISILSAVFASSLGRRVLATLLTASVAAGVLVLAPRGRAAAETLPKQLSDRAFWQMIVDFSEPNGIFRSDNLVSNEVTFQYVIPDLRERRGP